MFDMKTAMMIFAIILTLFNAPQTYALAEADAPSGKYACAAARDVYFCESRDPNTAKFVIPYKYCVLILGEEDGWYNVRYAEETQYYRPLYGWCKKDSLKVISSVPQKIFLDMPVSVTIKVDLPSESLPALSETVTVAYYGEYYSGAVPLSCVMYKNEFYYVPQTFEYPENEISLDSPQEQQPEKKNNAKIITAVALSAFAVSALVILYFTGRKKFTRSDA